jgi:hypothetical protein
VFGLGARGVLYLVLAFLAIELAVRGSGSQVDTRGAFHELAHQTIGAIVLVVLIIGFAAFALWHLSTAVRGSGRRRDGWRRAANLARAVVYALLCALALSFLTTSKPSGNSDRTDQTWTAHVLHWAGGRVLVGAVGLVVLGVGAFLVWRAVSGGAQDEEAVLDAAPRETHGVHVLGLVGNVARGLVVGLVGVFLLDAALQRDPNRTVGLDGVLRRLLGHGFGGGLVFLVGLGFAAFGVYSLARAWTNRDHATARA